MRTKKLSAKQLLEKAKYKPGTSVSFVANEAETYRQGHMEGRIGSVIQFRWQGDSSVWYAVLVPYKNLDLVFHVRESEIKKLE